MHLTPCYMHISQTDYSGIGHVHAILHCCTELGAPRAILGAPLFDMIVLLKRCRSSFVFCGTFQTGQLQPQPTQKLSTARVQPVTSAYVPTSPVCACI